MHTHPTLQRLFYELPVIKDPRAKKIATLILMQEFDYIVREARDIFEHYNMSCEHPIIDEILYNKDYMMRYVFKDNHTYDENTIKEVPPIHIIQQVFNAINKQYCWIVRQNTEGFEERTIKNAKILLDYVFPIVFEKPSSQGSVKDDNT